ncbi:MAG: hypothetical protein OHK93_000988 [Ramalina farinacea]|uniref:Uncharacterized protein n=1 Tax=Ramalina farinacea TaxID=258253 RepID=A0AA43QNN0_9LECA|nr:hypothetical protein [Ramalina farinacea]
MASTDSTIPDGSTGDATGTQSGQGLMDKAKSAVKGATGGSDGTVAKDETTKKVEEASGGGITGKTEGLGQNKLL